MDTNEHRWKWAFQLTFQEWPCKNLLMVSFSVSVIRFYEEITYGDSQNKRRGFGIKVLMLGLLGTKKYIIERVGGHITQKNEYFRKMGRWSLDTEKNILL